MVISRDDFSRIGYGVVSNTGQARPDITIFDSPEFGKSADELRQAGARVFGTSHWAQTLQDDPDYRQAVVRATWGTLEPVKQGIETYVSTWFNGNRFLATYLSMVYHRMTPGGKSPDVGFTGCVSSFWQPTQKVQDTFLEPITKVLRRVNHRGCFHIRSTIARDTFSITDIAASFEHPLSLMLFENSKCSIPDILLRLFNEDSTTIPPLSPWVSSVMLSVPPFPYTVHSLPTPLDGVIPANLKHLWLSDAMRENGKWLTTGSHGKVGYVTSRGATTSESCRRAYRTIRNLRIQDLQYRNDVGKNINHFLTSLRNSGWIK